MTNNKGFTLIELVMFIVVGAIFLPASMVAFTSVMSNYSRPDYYIKARFYAEQRMSELTATSYDSLIPGTCATKTYGAFTVECSITGVDSSTLSSNSSTSGTEPYKRIIIVVKHTRLLEDYYLRTIITRRPKKS